MLTANERSVVRKSIWRFSIRSLLPTTRSRRLNNGKLVGTATARIVWLPASFQFKPPYWCVDIRSATVSPRTVDLLAGGLGLRSLSSQCFVVAAIIGFFSLHSPLA